MISFNAFGAVKDKLLLANNGNHFLCEVHGLGIELTS